MGFRYESIKVLVYFSEILCSVLFGISTILRLAFFLIVDCRYLSQASGVGRGKICVLEFQAEDLNIRLTRMFCS